MRHLGGRFEQLRASDCMTRQVITLGADYTLRDAAMVLRAAEVSGAPVVDDAGRPVGILSSTDIIASTRKPRGAAGADTIGANEAQGGNGSNGKDWRLLDAAGFQIEQLPATCVQQYMSRRVVSVTEDTAILDVAALLCREHIHRVLVVDETSHIRGIISSLDLLAAMVSAADEVRRAH